MVRHSRKRVIAFVALSTYYFGSSSSKLRSHDASGTTARQGPPTWAWLHLECWPDHNEAASIGDGKWHKVRTLGCAVLLNGQPDRYDMNAGKPKTSPRPLRDELVHSRETTALAGVSLLLAHRVVVGHLSRTPQP